MAEYEGIPGFDVEEEIDEGGDAQARARQEAGAPVEENKEEVMIADTYTVYVIHKAAVDYCIASLITEPVHVGRASGSHWKGRVWQQQPRVSLPWTERASGRLRRCGGSFLRASGRPAKLQKGTMCANLARTHPSACLRLLVTVKRWLKTDWV